MSDQELAALRRRAYSRAGTEEDRRRLAELEAWPAIADSIGPSEEEEAAPVGRRRILIAGGVGALVGATLATAITLAWVSAVPHVDEPAVGSALGVFEREARVIDDPGNLLVPLADLFRDFEGSTPPGLDDATLRWIGSPAGYEVYAVRWKAEESVTVCLIVESTGEVVTECTTETDFVTDGLRMAAFGMELKWGPTGTEVWVNSFR